MTCNIQAARRGWPRMGLAVALAALAACSDTPSPSDAAAPPSPQALLAASGYAQADSTLDDDLERIARTMVPGYASQMVDADGHPVVFLKNPGAASVRAAERLVEAQARAHGRAPVRPRVRAVKYDFVELRGWQRQIAARAFGADVFAMDVDEAANRVWLAVADQPARGRVQALAAQLGIPADAVEVSVTGVPRPRYTLRAPPYPVHGGMQISNGTSLCSVGFSAYRSGFGYGFVTASHCSNQQYVDDNGTSYFVTAAAGNELGVEVLDADWDICYVGTMGRPCVNADATLFRYNAGRSYELGRIARTLGYGANQPGSLEIDPNNPTFRIIEKNTWGLDVGTWIDKVGRTSGWTRGQVTRRCFDFSVGGFWYQCQYESSTWSEGGDSGSPMFVVAGTGVSLHGLLWGGPENNWAVTWYAPVGR
ncbi:MAG TPA: hypothetical protein VFR37_04500, partial [Longimicrobium sp.]|nr:hypothetical protein [Longimicrobium sp.]